MAAGLLAACGSDVSYEERPESQGKRDRPSPPGATTESVFGPGGLTVFGGDKDESPSGGPLIGVNSYLWRASLDTVSFMPLASADPFGGVIITDWYSPPEVEGERFKLNVYILGRELRADGIRAAVFRQRQDPFVGWVDAKVDDQTATELEDAILTRARQLRISGLAQ
ncbi:MAG: DUF3576 domain-containing protein [Gemmatimonadetes bacterium]|nr:DUF3576 domain-containing protein [Gemmatimonadota bacterium]